MGTRDDPGQLCVLEELTDSRGLALLGPPLGRTLQLRCSGAPRHLPQEAGPAEGPCRAPKGRIQHRLKSQQ